MKRSLKWAALFLPLGLMSPGCNDNGGTRTSGTTRTTERTTTTTTTKTPSQTPNLSGNAKVDVGPNGANAAGQAANDRVDVDVAPNGGVDVNVQGEPIRDRIRERRAARDANVPR